MWETIWSEFWRPSVIFNNLLSVDFILAMTVIALLTLAFMAIAGRRIMRRSSILAVIGGALFLPVLMDTLAFLLALNGPDGTDGGGMLMGLTLMLSVAILPVTLAVSLLDALFRRWRGVR